MQDNNIISSVVFKINHAGGSGSCFYLKKYDLFISKFNDADNMGFGIPVAMLEKMLAVADTIDRSKFAVECSTCQKLIADKTQYCPACGNKIDEKLFDRKKLTDLAVFCEEAIQQMGINPILARKGNESWKFHKGSSEIRMFVYDREYLFTTSPINLLPKQNLEPLANITNLALKSDDLDNYLVEALGCEFSEYAKKEQN